MAETTQFELVSPERLVLSRDVEMVVIPGSEGYFGVLPRHSPMLTTLMPGVIDIHEGGSIVDRILVAGGFAEVTEDRCTVLAEGATTLAEVDVSATEKTISDTKEILKDTSDAVEQEKLQEKISNMEAMLAAKRLVG